MTAGLALSSVSHRFGERVALAELSFEVGAGEVVGLVGRNGAGKTTTLRAIMGVLHPDAGTVTWRSSPCGADDRRTFGYMPEERGLYPQMRLLDQLTYLATLHGMTRDAARAASQAWIDRLGLDGREQDRVIALSHGNQQRAQLAAAVVHDPPLLVLDEPFAGLDPEAVDVLSATLRSLAGGGAAILFSSHQLDVVEHICDRVVIVDAGRIRADGTLGELQARFPQQLRVQVRGGNGWAARCPGVTVTAERADGVLLELAPHADAQAVLRAAQQAGPVEHFGYESADLTDLFRRLVSEA